MKRKVIAFDLDRTLAPTKSPLPDRMAVALDKLLEKYQVCIISGGKFGQFEVQLLANLKSSPEHLAKLHLMPTSGTRYYKYDSKQRDWHQVYTEDIAPPDRLRIMKVLGKVIKGLGYEEKKTWGPAFEDRGSQVTWSALGQDIVAELGLKGAQMKEDWDPESKKKQLIRDTAAPLLPEFEVRVGGGSSIDVTLPGIDKAYGINRLMEILGVTKEEVFFIGDRIAPGGNDYPIKAMGVECIEVRDWEDTAYVVEAIYHVS